MHNKIISHPSIIHTNDIADICKPLRHLNINYFSHANITKNNEFSVHCSHPTFLEHYFNQRYYNSDIIAANTAELGKYVIWDALEYDGETHKMNQEAVEHGIAHTFSIIETTEQGTDFYNFSSNLIGNTINNEYIRHLDLLKSFINHFKSTVSTSRALSAAYHHTFTLDDAAPGFNIINPHTSPYQINTADFWNELNNSFAKPLLSKRQMQCLALYAKGKTAREISQEIGLSRRTVENYINIIKEKLGVSSKVELALLMLDKTQL